MKIQKIMIGIVVAAFFLSSCTALPQNIEIPKETEAMLVTSAGEGEFSITPTTLPPKEEGLFTKTLAPTKESTTEPQTIDIPKELEVIRLTYHDEEGDTGCPVWSPNGERIAYRFSKDEPLMTIKNIFIMNIDGSGGRKLTEFSGVGVGALEWSPDGSQMLFSILLGEPYLKPVADIKKNIYALSVLDAIKKPLSIEELELVIDLGEEINVESPSWSPDGEKILFDYGPRCPPAMAGDEGYIPDKLGIMEIDTGEIVYLLDKEEIDVSYATWSPDGEQIAFRGTEDDWETFNIWVMDADGKNLRQITKNHVDGSLTWSPDGKWIMFERDFGKDYTLHIVNIKTGELIQIADFEKYSCCGDWSPDGEWIVFVNKLDPLSNLYITKVKTGQVYKLTDIEGESWCTSWSPDGKLIAFTAELEGGKNNIYLLDMSWLEME